MATIAQLNVQIGASIANLQKGLKQAEREIRASGQKMARAGAEISASLSLPLALAGAGAISAAGDLESLTLALKSQLGSTEAARKEFELLNAAAKKPGIGLEQAVKGSVRLQGVKFSAAEARTVIEQMGNAIARTGGTAENLDSVTKQFAQMSSKGKVLQEDVSILSENMPAIAGLMEKAFGTTNVERIRAMGVGGKEFVLAIAKAAEALPRVEGGIKNSIGNALDSLKQSAAKFGFAINEAFNVSGALEKFSDFILSTASSFSNLDPVVKKLVLSLAGIAIAIGPILKIVGAVQLLRAQAVTAFEGIVGFLKNISARALNAAAAFQALSAAQKATVIGAAIAAATALYFAYDNYANSLSDAEKAQRAVNDVMKSAAASVEEEKAKVNNLVLAIDDNSRSLKDKKAALEQLKALNPKYFGDLDIENGKVVGLAVAVDRYARSLERAATVKFATEEIGKLRASLVDIGKAGDPTLLQKTYNGLKSFGVLLAGGGLAGKEAVNTFNQLNESTRVFNQLDLQKESEAKIAALQELVKQNLDLDGSQKAVNESTKKYGDITKDTGDKAKVLKEVLSDIQAENDRQSLLGLDDVEPKLRVAESGLKRLLDAGWKPNSQEVIRLAGETRALKAEFDKIAQIKPVKVNIDIIRRDTGGGGLPEAPNPGASQQGNVFSRGFEEQQKLAETWKRTYIDTALEISSAIGDIFNIATEERTNRQIAALEAEGAARLRAAKGNAALEAAIQADLDKKKAAIEKKAGLRRKIAAIAEAVINTAVAVTKALTSAIPPFNIPAAVAAAAAGAAQIAVISAQKFAAGTRDAPGGLALVGERGPEFVNLPRHSQVFSAGVTATALRAQNSIHITGEFRARGTDLISVIDSERFKKDRVA